MPCQNVNSIGPVADANASVGQFGNVSSNAAVVVGAIVVSTGGNVSPTGRVTPGASVICGGWVTTVGCLPAVTIDLPEPHDTAMSSNDDRAATRLTL